MPCKSIDSFNTYSTLEANGKTYGYYSLKKARENGLGEVEKLPYSLRILLENMLRFEDNRSVFAKDVKAVADWAKTGTSNHEIAFRPGRVLMQDLTGVPAVVDLAAMREAMKNLGENPEKINPLNPVDLIIDHSVWVDYFGDKDSLSKNMDMEFTRNGERYEFLRWGQQAFDNFRVVPPGSGIIHQVNLEYLAKVVWTDDKDGQTIAYPDTLVGTDSHTVMINGMGVLGWGVGGIEAEAAMLGQPISLIVPDVVGFELTGKLAAGVTPTDLVLTVVQILREKGVVGKFVEFTGEGVASLSLADRAIIANMAPEYGATCGFFPIDNETLDYMKLTGRNEDTIALTQAYAKAQGLWWDKDAPKPVFSDTVTLDISTVQPTISGPKHPKETIALGNAAQSYAGTLKDMAGVDAPRVIDSAKTDTALTDGDIVIAAINSCTNTSNPDLLIAAGLLAKKAAEKGLVPKPWVKTSFTPGSLVVRDYLQKAGLLQYLEQLRFNICGFGCATCIGNSGELIEGLTETITANDMVVASVTSGNRNFEGRISPYVKANYLASPPLVVAYALAGNMRTDLTKEPLGTGHDGKAVYLADIWPDDSEVRTLAGKSVKPEQFRKRYGNIGVGPEQWQKVPVTVSETYNWDSNSTYVRNPPYFEGMTMTPPKARDITGARALLVLGDSVTTDHISPASAIRDPASPAGIYLCENGVAKKDFNSFGSRRGNHEVMMRGTFANVRLKNEMAPGTEGGFTKLMPENEDATVFDAAQVYKKRGTPLVVFAGKDYGTGSSRDWAAKGPYLLGVRAVVAESYERIHRSNLIGMGILPLEFVDGQGRKSYKLNGTESFDITGIKTLKPGQNMTVNVTRANGEALSITTKCRIDTADELEYYRHGGILHYTIRQLANS